MRSRRATTLASAGILSLILMLSVAYYWPIQDDYHPLNTDWNGCSIIAEAGNATLIQSYETRLPNGSSLLAIIGPSLAFSRMDAARIRSFLEVGGTILLADDIGSGNSLLEELNVSARFSGKPLADLYYYSKQPRFPVVVNFVPSPVAANLTAIVLNHPSFINISASNQVIELASSSPFSFIDLTPTDKPLANETIASYPVMANVKIGNGSLFLISDPNMFDNEMIGLYDNMRLFRNLLKLGNESLYFDVAHLAVAPLTNWRIMLKEGLESFHSLTKENAYIPLLVAAVLIFGFSFELVRISRRNKVAK